MDESFISTARERNRKAGRGESAMGGREGRGKAPWGRSSEGEGAMGGERKVKAKVEGNA